MMIYFNEYGERENPTILLLHGAAALDTFCNQYCFSNQYHLVVPHLHGAGKSADKAYEPERMKQELFTLIDNLHKDKIGVIGHSLGGQLAVMLVCERPEQFNFAVFLSTWVNPNSKIIGMYCFLAGVTTKILHWKWLVHFQGKYWHYTKAQADYMAEYSKLITSQVYKSFFLNTLNLQEISVYLSIDVPMLAICGSREMKDMKVSLDILGKNVNCKTIIFSKSGHDFPMRKSKQLNSALNEFLLDKVK